MDPQELVNGLHMVVDRVLADAESGGNPLFGKSVQKKIENAALRKREQERSRLRRRGVTLFAALVRIQIRFEFLSTSVVVRKQKGNTAEPQPLSCLDSSCANAPVV